MYGYIYETTNLVNGKKYIGQKKSEVFLGEKYLGSGKHLKQAIAYYGADKFKVRLVEECIDLDELNQKEIYWIDLLFKTYDRSMIYNIAQGGNQWGPKFHSEESKMKMKQSAINRWKDPQQHINQSKIVSKSRLGMKHSEQTKQKLREKKLGKNNPRYGKHYSKDDPAYIKLKSRHWYTNGIEEVFTKECPDGYYAGRKNFRKRDDSNESVG